jgi:hypothetical protein
MTAAFSHLTETGMPDMMATIIGCHRLLLGSGFGRPGLVQRCNERYLAQKGNSCAVSSDH